MEKISVNLPPELLKRLEEEKKFNKSVLKSTTTVVQEALALYFMAKDRERLAPVVDPLRFYPLTPAECTPEPSTPYMQDGVLVTREIQEGLKTLIEEEDHRGLLIPTIGRHRLPTDLTVRDLPIKGGDGVQRRLLNIGINPTDIIKAKRNKRAGREYDKSLEKYFDLL